MGHAPDLDYSSSGQVTQITSQASQRSLYLTWSTPPGASFPHVTSVSTDPVTPGDSSTAVTWQYDYSGDELTAACNESESGQPCTAHTYQSGSDYPAAVLNSGPRSYWRLDEDSGTTAASSVLTNEAPTTALTPMSFRMNSKVRWPGLRRRSARRASTGLTPTCRCPRAWPMTPPS